MRIQKRYFGETNWQEITEAEAQRTLEPFYDPVEPILEEIASGFTVTTNVAEFKRIEEPS